MNSKPIKIGLVGTGFISSGFVHAVAQDPQFTISKALTRRYIPSCKNFPRPELLTNSVNELLDNSDILMESTGDVIQATDVIDLALQRGIPVVTMDTEFHVTTGSYFVDKGIVTEAEGDQPGCTAALYEEVIAMGFQPLVFGNVKGFHNPDPDLQEMQYWAEKQGLSLPMTIASTDGTKVQFEQAFIANAMSCDILGDELIGESGNDFAALALNLAEKGKLLGRPISDYIICPKRKERVFIVATTDSIHKEILQYLKMGDGPNYIFTKDWTLCHLEILKTVRRVVEQGRTLLHNSTDPTVSVAAIAKKDLAKGTEIQHSCGNLLVRGIAVKIKNHQNHAPIGLLQNARLKANVSKGQILSMADVELPESKALNIWQKIEQQAFPEKH